MVVKRQAYKLVILEPAKSRLERGECPSCGKPKSKWKRSTRWRCCSKRCTAKFHKYFYAFGWPDLRSKAFKRDNYTCRKCGKIFIVRDVATGKEYGRDSELIADHIIPIALNGDQWDINNVQTLCIQCNKIKTKQDQGLIASARRREKQVLKGQKTLPGFT